MRIRINGFIPSLFLTCLIACSPSPTKAPTRTSTHTATSTETRSPTSTHTAAPSATFTVTPGSTPEMVSTPAPSPDTVLEQRDDGVWVYSDNDAGFQFEVGSDWYLEDVSALEVTEILGRTQDIKSELGITGVPVLMVEPDGMRIIGLYLDDSIADYMSVFMNAAYFVSEESASMTLDEFASRFVYAMAENHGLTSEDFEGAKITNENKVEYGAITFPYAENFYQLRIIVKVNAGFYVICFGYSVNNFDVFKDGWGNVVESLRHIE